MFWRKKRRHRLPKFPATVAQTFKMLCAEVSDSELEELKAAVDYNYSDIIRKSEENKTIDVEAAKKLVECCYFLLDTFEDYTPENRRLVVGAVRYFAIADDPFDDEIFANGFYDDMRVMNYVLEEIGVEDRYFSVQ